MTTIEFFKRVGIIAGAIAAVGTVLSPVGAVALRAALRPTSVAIAAEREARESADDRIVDRMLDVLDVATTRAGYVRDVKLKEIRARWAREDAKLKKAREDH